MQLNDFPSIPQSSPRVSGVLEVDLSPAAGEHGYFTARDAAALIPLIPVGVTVELRLGNTTPLGETFGPLVDELRPAGAIIVRGTKPAAVAAMYQGLHAAYAQAGAA